MVPKIVSISLVSFCLLMVTGSFLQVLELTYGYSYSHLDQRQTIKATELPKEAQNVILLVKKGGPFPYPKDGTFFNNRERRLPQKHKGYYREYTVPTPGIGHRGARRVIAGEAGELYYTDDHYNTFKLILE